MGWDVVFVGWSVEEIIEKVDFIEDVFYEEIRLVVFIGFNWEFVII